MVKRYSLLLSVLFLSFASFSATYYSRANGNWNAATTWSVISCTGAASGAIPGAADNVVICTGRTVSMSGAAGSCLSLNITGTLNWTGVNTITVGTGGLTLNNGSTVSGTVTGTLSIAGPVTIPSGAIITLGNVSFNAAGTTTLNGRINFTNIGGTKTFTNLTMGTGAEINYTADITCDISGTLSMSGATINANPSQLGTFNVNNFTIGTGTSVFGVGNLTVTGATTINGTIQWPDRTGMKILNNVLINSGGSFNNTSNESFVIQGDFTVNGTFIAGNRNYSFNGAGKVISGTSPITINQMTVNGSVTNNASLTVGNRIVGTGSFTQGATGVLNMQGNTLTVNTFNTSASGNIVNYTMPGGFNIPVSDDGSYASLTLTNGTKSLTANTVVNGSLLISAGTTFNTSSFNLNLGGNFTNNGTFTALVSTVTFQGTAPQSIGGTNTSAFSSLTLAANAFVNGNTNFSVGSTLTVGTGATLAPAAGVIVSGTGLLTGTGTVRVTRIAATADFITQYSITGKTLTNLTVDYIGAGNQSVNILNYGSLTISANGARTVTMNAGVVGVSNVFSPDQTLTSYIITGNTVDFNGTLAQSIPSFNYNNLTSSSSGARTLSAAGTIGIAGVFTPGTNAYTVTGSTVNYNGTLAQTVIAFNYWNLSSSSTGSRTLASSGIIGIANVFTIGTNAYTVVNSTVNFNGSAAQTIPAFNFYHLTSSSSGSRILSSTGIIGIAGIFTPGTNAYTNTGSTLNFNGLFAQNIPPFNFFNVSFSTPPSAKTLTGNIIVDNNLTNSTTLDVSAGNFSITCKGNWVNNGTFIPRSGTVTFSGTAGQTLSGTAATSFENLAIANTSSGVQLISGTYLLNGALLISSGNFNTNGNSFTMVSTATKTARIGEITGGSISGSFTVQRFLSTRTQNPVTSHWSDLASPVQSATMADWDAELFLSYTHSPPSIYSNVVAFDEALDDYVGVSAGTALTPGKGFEIALTDDATLTSFTNTTLTTGGVPSQGTQDLSSLISFVSSGSNLVGNPYASNISWSTVFANSSGILSTYDEYDSNAGTYATFGLGTEIAAGQGFWVYTTSSSATLIVTEDAKTTASNSSVKSAVASENHLTLTLKGKNETNPFAHTLKIASSPTATNGIDTEDHPFRKSPLKEAPSITTQMEGREFSINTFMEGQESYSLPLITRTGISGEFEIEVKGTGNLPEYSCIRMEDKLSGKNIVLTEGMKLPVYLSAEEAPDRFILHLGNEESCKAMVREAGSGDIRVHAIPEGNLVSFDLSEATPLTIDVLSILGQQIVESRTISASTGTEKIRVPDAVSGMYLIRISTPERTSVWKFFRN